MLNDGGVDNEFVLWWLALILGLLGLGDELLEDATDDGVVPCLGLRVLV